MIPVGNGIFHGDSQTLRTEFGIGCENAENDGRFLLFCFFFLFDNELCVFIMRIKKYGGWWCEEDDFI